MSFFLSGESFCDGVQSRHWQDFALTDLLVCVPDPYWFCFHRGLTWTCSTVIPDPYNKLSYGGSHLANHSVDDSGEILSCRLNGRFDLNLREHLGDEMPPKASRTVHIDTKVSALFA